MMVNLQQHADEGKVEAEEDVLREQNVLALQQPKQNAKKKKSECSSLAALKKVPPRKSKRLT